MRGVSKALRVCLFVLGLGSGMAAAESRSIIAGELFLTMEAGTAPLLLPVGAGAHLLAAHDTLVLPVMPGTTISADAQVPMWGGFHLLGPRGGREFNALVLVISDQHAEILDAATGETVLWLGESTFELTGNLAFLNSNAVALDPFVARSVGLRQDKTGVGSAAIRIELEPADGTVSTGGSVQCPDPPAGSPDVQVCFIHKPGAGNYGSENDIAAFAFGTTSTNVGDVVLQWHQHWNEHPVIAQNVFRLRNNRFEQIGQSWLKHGFAALAQNQCGLCQNPMNTSLLGIGCSDPYAWSLNGWQSTLGPKSQVNAFTGCFPYPFTAPPIPDDPDNAGSPSKIARRVQIHHDDIDPTLNPGASYFVEGQYVTADDAVAGNGENNASWHQVNFSPDTVVPYTVQVAQTPTQQSEPAIMAWRDPDGSGPIPPDPDVMITQVKVPGEGVFFLGAKAWELGDGFWAYEYAIQNLNSHRSCRSFTVPIHPTATVRNIGFHDVDYHSGEPYDGTDWPGQVNSNNVTWETGAYDDALKDEQNNHNALRWGTLYNFRFESQSPPNTTTVTLGLYRPGFPETVTASIIGPLLDMFDCNENLIEDACDISCDALPECVQPCGISDDCDANGVPDECQADCNENDVADACDIGTGASQDCNLNTVPDECENDCDGDGIIDDCDPPTDCDDDGIEDCDDLCKCSSGSGGCVCPAQGECCFPNKGFCFGPYPWQNCIEDGGVPECAGSPCRGGCRDDEVDGDWDRDGDRDHVDIAALWSCFTSDFFKPFYTPPSLECAVRFDFDIDNDIDLTDVEAFLSLHGGPKLDP